MGMSITVQQVYGIRVADIASRKVVEKSVPQFSSKTGQPVEPRVSYIPYVVLQDGREFCAAQRHDEIDELTPWVKSLGLEFLDNDDVLGGIIGLTYGDELDRKLPNVGGEIAVLEPSQEITDKVNAIVTKEKLGAASKWIWVDCSY